MQQETELCFIPALITLIVNAQHKKGTALTRQEVEAIRDNGVCIALPTGSKHLLAQQRGYADFDAEYIWQEYLNYLNSTITS